MTPSCSHSFALAVLLVALGLAACRAPRGQTTPQWPPMVEGELGSMHTVSFAQGLWFGSEPSALDVELAQRRGVERVIDLCSSARTEVAEASAGFGLEWAEVPMLAGDDLDDRSVDRVLSLLGEENPPRTLMYCEDGSVSAALFAIHRVVQCGVPVEDALAEARRAGMRPDPGQARVRRQIGRLRGQPPAP